MPHKHEKNSVRQSAIRSFVHRFWGGLSIALLGIVIGQAILYGPSLSGKKMLLPLRMLAVSGNYLPLTEQYRNLVPRNSVLSDLVFYMEPERRFVNSEIRSGRIPLWNPHRFAGTPLYTIGLSPPWLLAYLIASPTVLAWAQLLIALIAGLGMYYFCVRILKLSTWPSIIAAWCYPVTAAYILWVGQWLPAVMCLLPWALAAVDRTVRAPRGWGGPALCVVTILLLTGGALDIAGQVLLVSGLYALWCIWDENRSKAFSSKGLRVAAKLLLSITMGFACSAWLLIPLSEYVSNGSRIIQRSAGKEERPPVGLATLPQIVLPDIYGSSQHGSIRIGKMVLPESAAAMYAGSVACLVLAPLAWFSRKRRSITIALAVLAFFSLGWAGNLPGIVHLLRLPVLNMMSHNRLVFVGGFALIVLAAIGLEVLMRREVSRKAWLAIPALTLVVLCCWCIHRSLNLPEPVASQLGAAVRKAPIGYIDEPWEVAAIQHNFRKAYAIDAVFCGLGATALTMLLLGYGITPKFISGLLALQLIQLFHFGYNYAPQSSHELYFPKIPALQHIAASPPGRIIGFGCLPANLAQSIGLSGIRGYDGVDPKRIVQLLKMARHPQSGESSYAATQYLKPAIYFDQSGSLQIHPIMRMLGVRYVLFRGTPPPNINPFYADGDYWILENRGVLPRAFIPRKVVLMDDAQERLKTMSSLEFDARETAYVEQPVSVPPVIDGAVEISVESPQRITLTARMNTQGLVVLADRWDAGWRAYINDIQVPILRVNHALRGVRVNSGISTIRFVYDPASLKQGLAIAACGGVCWLTWAFILLRRRSKGALLAEETSVSAPLQPEPASSFYKEGTPHKQTARRHKKRHEHRPASP